MSAAVPVPGSVSLARIGPPLLLIGAFCAASIAWIARDMTVWPWDQALYGSVTLDLRHAQTLGVRHWANAMMTAIGFKPPGLPWLAQFFTPLHRLFGGRLDPALLLANVAAQAGMLALVWLTARRLGAGVLAGLTAVALAGGASLSLGMVHQFLVEAPQGLCVALFLWAALEAPYVSRLRFAALMTGVTAASFLVKSSSFGFVLPMLTYAAVARLIAWHWPKPAATARSRLIDGGLLLLAIAGLAATVGWYARNWGAMRQHFINATSNEIALAYGSIGTLGTKLDFWLRSFAQAVSPWPVLALALAVLIALALIVALYRLTRVRMSEAPGEAVRSGMLYALALTGLILVNILGLATQINEETRFLAPLLPILAVLVGWALTVLGSRLVAGATLLAALGNAGVAVAYTHGADPLRLQPSVWLKPVSTDPSGDLRMAAAVTATCAPRVPQRIEMIGVEYPWFNANTATYYAAKLQPRTGARCYYTSLGYAEADPTKALARLEEFRSDYFLTIRPDLQPQPPNFLNGAALPVLERLRGDARYAPLEGVHPELVILRRLP